MERLFANPKTVYFCLCLVRFEKKSWSHGKMLRFVASILRLILVRDSTFFVLLLLISGDVWLLVVKYDSKELIVFLFAVFRGYRFLKLYFRVLKYHFYI